MAASGNESEAGPPHFRYCSASGVREWPPGGRNFDSDGGNACAANRGEIQLPVYFFLFLVFHFIRPPEAFSFSLGCFVSSDFLPFITFLSISSFLWVV